MTFVPTRDVASCLRASSMNVDDNTAQDGHLIATADTDRMTFVPINTITGTVTTRWGGHYDSAQEVRSGAVQPGLMVPEITGTVTTTWAKGPGNTQVEEGHVIPVAIAENQRGEVSTSDVDPSIGQGGGKPGQGYAAALTADLAVRRLTPTECERLMGWPDGWTAEGVDTDGNPVTIADSNRYRMCGNGVATPVAEWIGRCILNAEADQ